MSTLYNEYIISSNNSINDNKYNAQKAAKSPSKRIKNILKPLMRMLRHKSSTNNSKKNICREDRDIFIYENHKNSSIESSQYCDDSFWSTADCEDDNSANEELESRIFHEIEQCPDDAAVYVYNNDECEIKPVHREQQYVPVHFARTEAGTFFWTTMQKPVDYDLVQPTYCCSDYQQPQLQFGDRWVQA